MKTLGPRTFVRYDILKIEPNGDREYFIKGTIYMKEGYTAQ